MFLLFLLGFTPGGYSCINPGSVLKITLGRAQGIMMGILPMWSCARRFTLLQTLIVVDKVNNSCVFPLMFILRSFVHFIFLSHILFSGTTPGNLGNQIGCKRLNPGHPQVRKMPKLLHYFSENIFCLVYFNFIVFN